MATRRLTPSKTRKVKLKPSTTRAVDAGKAMKALGAEPTKPSTRVSRKLLEGIVYQTDLLMRDYREQLDEVGRLLVRAKFLTRRAIQRDGVRFALANKLEPKRRIRLSRSRRTP